MKNQQSFPTPLATERQSPRTTDSVVFDTRPGAGGGSPASDTFSRVIDHADVILVALAIVGVAYLIGVLVWTAGGGM